MRIGVSLPGALLCALAAASSICAQQANTSATLHGVVQDATPAVLRGVRVVAENTDLSQEWSDVTDESGRYQFLRLPPGSYVLSASADGFQPFVRTFRLGTGQAVDLPVTLSVQRRQESIDVTENTVLLETARTQVAGSVSATQVDSLPLNGRNYLDLALLVPGVSRTNTGVPQQFAETSAVPGTGISVSGQRNLNNSFVVDGLSANDDAAGLAGTYFSQEVIREFQVVTAGANAEFGRASSGFVNVATRSGTSEWHSRIYGYLRNQRMDARNALATGKDPLTQTQYGATAGGPLARSRTFLFANFEQTHRNAAGYVTITPANVTAINGALGAFGYPGPRISTGEFPTGWDLTNGFARVDHQISRQHQLVVRYSAYAVASDNARSVGGLSAVTRGTRLDNRDSTVAASEIATLTPHALNEIRVQATRSRLSAPPNDAIGPAVSIAGVANFGTSTTSPVGRDLDLYEGADTMTLVHGNHAFKLGADFLLNRVNIYFPGAQAAAVYNFSSMPAFLAGRYTTFQQAFGDAYQFQSNPNVGMFAQDDWKVARGVTISAGLRYDVQRLPAPIQTYGGNVAPRFGLAWSPGGRTVVRASYGLFYDRIPLRATSNALQRDGSKYRVALLAWGQAGAPAFPQQLAEFPEGQYINITTIDPAIRSGYSHQASVEVERELRHGVFASLGYEWVRGLHLILSRNVNVPTLSAAAAAAQGIPNLGRPDMRYGNVSRYESSGDSYYHAMMASLRGRVFRFGELSVAYTLSKAIDDTGNFFFSTPQNNFDLRDDRGLSDNDQRHRLSVSGTLFSPVAAGSSWASRIGSNWRLASIFRYTSALPFNVQLNYDRNNDTSLNDRPAGVGRNTERGFDFASLDTRVSREFRASERVRLEAMVEAFNMLNRVNFAVPNNVIGADPSRPAGSFGRPTAVLDPRQFQVGVRVSF